MRFKKTRTAFSVSCGMLCLLLIGLWIRSQSTADEIQFRLNSTWGGQIRSVLGSVDVFVSNELVFPTTLLINNYPLPQRYTTSAMVSGMLGNFGLYHQGIKVPYWFLLMFNGIAAALLLPYWHIQWRFSLRTLLVFITLVSLLLGLIIYFAKR